MIEEDDASDDRQFIFLPYLPLPLVRYPFPLRYPEAGREGVICLFIGIYSYLLGRTNAKFIINGPVNIIRGFNPPLMTLVGLRGACTSVNPRLNAANVHHNCYGEDCYISEINW